MSRPESMKIGYVLRRYPRYSETFIVREILAHEAAGAWIQIFSLRPPNDTHFQDLISRVRGCVTYLPSAGLRDEDLWRALQEASVTMPGIWSDVEAARGDEARTVYQALVLARLAREQQLDHLHAPFANDGAAVARLASRFARIPYSVTARAKEIFHNTARQEELRQKFADAAAIITISDYHLAYLRATFGPAASRVHRVYNGLDLERFVYLSPSNRPRRIVAIGRLVEKKGFEDLIDACAILAARQVEFSCQVVGGGPLEAELRGRVERHGLPDRVQLIGPRPEREVVDIVQAAAVLAAPCVVGADGDRDGLPNVLFEAMALGTPCVSTDVTAIPEILRDGQTGLLVPQHEPHSLAAALERLLDDPPLRIRLAESARRLIETEFDAARNAGRRRAIFAASRRAARSAA
jgi:colanic acid/amylovoran biosynthesis glycosyltransferase